MKFILISLLVFYTDTFLHSVEHQTIWLINNLTEIDGKGVVVYGNPKIIVTEKGSAMEFNADASNAPATGKGDRIQIKGNPLGISANDFTIEMIFKPYLTTTDFAPRVLHICSPDSMSGPRVMTMEIRSTNVWNTDFYIKSVTGSGIMGSKKYQTGQWMHLAMTYKNGELKGYVNGEIDVSYVGSKYTGLPANAEVSLGGRMNNVNYFKGAVLKLIFTSEALEPSQFTLIDVTGINNIPVENKFLLTNSPNPVNNHSTISFRLTQPEKVRIDLLNSMGQIIKLIHNNEIEEGNHEIDFQRENLPAGIYFYKLTTPSGINETGKMLIK